MTVAGAACRPQRPPIGELRVDDGRIPHEPPGWVHAEQHRAGHVLCVRLRVEQRETCAVALTQQVDAVIAESDAASSTSASTSATV